jgi:hypothetical protein
VAAQVLLARARRIALLLQRQMNQAAPQPMLQVSRSTYQAAASAHIYCKHHAGPNRNQMLASCS